MVEYVPFTISLFQQQKGIKIHNKWRKLKNQLFFNIFPISYVKYMYDSNEKKAPSTACVALLFRLTNGSASYRQSANHSQTEFLIVCCYWLTV